MSNLIIAFEGDVFYWRGPAPFLFVAAPEAPSRDLKAILVMAALGWGVAPVHTQIENIEWKTSLFPKADCCLVPIRKSVQIFEDLYVGEKVFVQLHVD